MDIQSIFNAGGTVIKNPNYKKGKKNTQPEYITVSDLDSGVAPDGSLVAGIAYDAAAKGQQSILGRNGELDKYINAGLTPNGWEDLDSQLAETQGIFSKFGNALAQAVVSEFALGTIKSFSDLFDLIGQGVGLADGDYSNPVSEFLEEKQEEFRNFAPIYSDSNLHISNGGLLDAGWWASNIPSIVSSLTLLLPSSGIVKGASYLGKLGKVSSRTRNAVRVISGVNSKMKKAEALRKAGKSAEEIAELTKLNGVRRFLTSASTAKQTSLFLENATTAALSRAMENYQEARQTYNNMYVEASEYFKDDNNYKTFIEQNKDRLEEAGVNITDKDSVAKYVSSSAADRTFQIDWFNVGWDVVQMYGLRNAWKGLRNANGTPSTVRRAEKDAEKYFGKKPEEIAKLKAQRSFMEKAGEWTSDKLYGSKLIIGSELSEGAEEALNYIATEEGMRFGRVLLGSEKGENKGVWENIINGFDGRLSSYLQSPELYDAAFWGVLGGVVFQAGGSALKRIGQKFEKSDADEKAKKSTPWYQLDELPENQRRISEIEARATDFATYKKQLDKINSGIDIYNSTENNEVRFSSKEEADVAREKLKDEFIASMTLRAMNAGNYNMLKAFLKNDNVRKNLIESGVFGKAEENGKSASDIEAESKEYIDSAVRRMDEIANMYEEELTAIDYASSRIGNDVLAEYMQIMANNNVHTQLALRQNNLSLAGTNARIAQLEDQFRDKLDPSINHANNIKVGLISSELGKLYAEKRNITKQEDSISKTISLENINKKIKTLEDELSNEELVFATSLALRYTKGEDGKYTTSDTSDYFEYRDSQIINRTEDMAGRTFASLTGLDLSDRARTILNEEELQKYKVLEQDAGSSFSALKQISPELNDLYATRAATELSSKMLNSELVRTVDEVKDYANMLHNTMSEARVIAINQASKTILNLYKKYGKDIEFYAIDYFNEEIRTKNLSENERRDLDDAFKVLALSKSYNKNLGIQLELMFRQYDAIEASKDSADDNEQGEENTTNSEANTGTINQDVNNTTETTIQADTEQENKQLEENQPITDPQETESRNPAYYATFWFPKGVLSSRKHSNTDNGGAAVYDNNDGTFTLDVRDNKRALNDNRFFSNADEVDLTRPYEVVEKPILKKNKKGKLEIYKQGRLVNTDTLEYQAAQQEEQQSSQPNEEQSTETNKEQVTEQSTKTTTTPINDDTKTTTDNVVINPSTGGVVGENSQITPIVTPRAQQKPFTEDIASVYDDVIPDETTTEDEIRMSSLGRFQREFKANNDVDLDAIATEIINAEVKKGQDRQVVEAAVNKSLAIIKRVIERKKGKASESTMKSSIDEVVVESSIVELTSRNPFIEDYTNAVRNMINEFCKELGINEYNGKKYINLEDLLRYVNTISNDSQMSNMMFDALKVYLNTDEAKTKFITTDETQNSDILKKNIAKSAAQRYQERLSDTTTQRVNIWDLRNSLSSQKEIKEFEEAIEALNKGDKLTYTRKDNKIILKDAKGRTIGTLSIPTVNSKTGAYEMTNDGWKYDILTQAGGTINSKLKTLFSRWLNEVNDASKELNAIIYELAFEKTSAERRQELLAKFIENKEIKAAKAQGFIDNKAGSEKLINGLVKLWKYRNYTDGDVTSSRNRRIDRSLNSWFSKLCNSYDGVSYLINNKDGEIEVANISDGEIIRASETNGQEAALPADRAIAGGVNPAIHKLAISSRTPNTLTVSGMPSINFSGVGKMNTFVLLPNRNGSYEYVQAYPADIVDDYIGKEAKEIIKSIQNRILELLDNHSKNPTQESFNEVKEFVKSVLSNHNGNSSLFWNLRLFEQGNTFGISLNNETKIVINAKNGNVDVSKSEYKPNDKGYRQKQMQLGTHKANEAITELLNNLRFNLNPTYIASDNATNTILNGIAKRRNGKFEITIGDKTWSYDSYNAFVLNNNLVRLNTKPNERGTSNFNPRGSRTQSANQVLEIRINNTTTSPVEGTTEEQHTVEPVAPNVENVSIPDKALAILNGTQQSSHVGNDIAALVFKDKQLKALKDLELLPEKLIFDENFNNQQGYETINAEYNDKTKRITVGPRWLNLFNNPTTRNQAIRKLIHEQLHYKLSKNKGYVRSVQSIYDEFKEYLNKNNVPKDAHIRDYLFENESTQLRALEEFLVESLTSGELAKYLNSIETSVPTKRGAKNLWQRILIALSDIFGWNVTKGSLYEKELNTIRELQLSSETKTQNNSKPTKNKEYDTTDEFDKLQEESLGLSETKIQQYHKGYRGGINGEVVPIFGDEDRQRLGRIYKRVLSRGTNTRTNSRTTLIHKSNNGQISTFNIAAVSPKLFHDIFEINRKYLPNGELVDLHDDYSNCKCFISDDGLCGFAIEEDGNLVSVFSLNPSTKRGFLYAIKDFIIKEGANHLDAYVSPNQNLENIYKKVFGFKTASTMDYNMEYDHDDIAKNHNNPKVVFMVLSEDVVENKHFDKNSYDEVEKYQHSYINKSTQHEKIEVQDEEKIEEKDDDFVDFSDDLIDEFNSSITEQPVSQAEPVYTKEEQDILSRAPRNTKGQLLAPNGKVSNLTEKQYAQVRTKAFKNWFGDWINAAKANMISLGKEIPNTDKYSKYGQKGETDIEIREVLDENGNVIGTVRMEFSGKNRNGVVTLHPQLSVTGKGYGTALYQHIADTYGIPVEESFGEIGKSEAGKALWNKLQRDNNTQISKGDIPLRQLLPTNASKVVDENGEPLVVYHSTNKIFNTYKERDGIHFGSYDTALGVANEKFDPTFDTIEEAQASIAKGKFRINQVFLNIRNPKQSKDLGTGWKQLITEGFDGGLYKAVEGDISFVVFNPNQIKSATDNVGTFSNEDDNVYHSSITEERITLMPNVPSVASISNMLPLEQQPEFDALVASAEFETSCR